MLRRKIMKLVDRVLCFLHYHRGSNLIFRTSIEPESQFGICLLCSACCKPFFATHYPIVRWVEIQRLGNTYQAFTGTFHSPEDVPRAQRIPNTMCFPLIESTQHYFKPYSGDSPADRQAIHDSRHDKHLDKLEQ